jgi:hypothetical protein
MTFLLRTAAGPWAGAKLQKIFAAEKSFFRRSDLFALSLPKGCHF